MIEISSGKIIPANEEDGTPRKLTVFIKVDGKGWCVGGLNPDWTREEIQQHLDNREQEIIADITKKEVKQVVERLDLKAK